MNKIILTFILSCISISLFAQDYTLQGNIIDNDNKEAISQATIHLLKTDSTYVAGSISNEKGKFQLSFSQKGRYILRITNVGYTPLYHNIRIEKEGNTILKDLHMKANAIMLKGTTVTAQALKVRIEKDTFIYNSAAYRTPEGSTVEELIKRLPGAQIDDDGKITINGKEVKKIKIDGKEFMTGDTKTAIKNLPTTIVDKVKSYNDKSDNYKATGIDDGNEETVLDFGLKRGMNKGLFSNIDLSLGTKSRYAERLMAAYFKDDYRAMLFGNANNVNDMGFPGGGGRGNFGRGQTGLNANKMLGTNFNYEKKDKLKIDGSLRWNHSDGDTQMRSSIQNFLSTTGGYSNSLSQSYTRSNQWNAQARLKWQPDTMTTISFRPRFSYSTNDARTNSMSVAYNEDPYQYITDPLSSISISQLANNNLVANTQHRSSISYNDSKNVSGTIQYTRKLSTNGRNFSISLDGSSTKSNNTDLSISNVHLYLLKNHLGNDSVYQTNRYNVTPTKTYSYGIQATYSEPILRGIHLQFRYKYSYSHSKSDRATYDFSDIANNLFDNITATFRGWNNYLLLLPYSYDIYRDYTLSRYSEYKNYTQEAEIMLRIIRSKYQLNFGTMLQPQKSHFIQNYRSIITDTARTVVNFTPTIDFRYKFSHISELRLNYRTSTAQPSMSDMLDIVDDSNPLNIKRGNPGLKPSFTNRLYFFYNSYFEKSQRSVMSFVNYSNTRNSISNRVTYDLLTGGRTTTPDNINGNWNMDAGLMFNTPIDTAGIFNLNTFTTLAYNNYSGYIALNSTSSSQKNITRNTVIGEKLEISLRKSLIEFGIDGSFNYTHSRNKLQSIGNLDTWQFAYGATINITSPWGTSLSTDLHQNSRRGYSDNALNMNELIWNAQLSQGFLRGKSLTISLQLYDILRKQSNISRSITAYGRTDTEYNSINSYVMVHMTYRFNLFGGGNAREEMNKNRQKGRPNTGDFSGPKLQRGNFPGGGRPPRVY